VLTRFQKLFLIGVAIGVVLGLCLLGVAAWTGVDG
jgi:hypothetical protein